MAEPRHTTPFSVSAGASRPPVANDLPSSHRPNPGIPFDAGLLDPLQVNLSAVHRRVASLPARRTVKKQWQAAWLLRGITLMDLTTLTGDETAGRIDRLCAKAKQPLRPDIARALGVEDLHIKTGAVCVYPTDLIEARAQMQGSGVPVAVVSAAFPHGRIPLHQRVAEVQWCADNGADEIDIVIDRGLVLSQDWKTLYDEVKELRQAAGEAHLKTILATGQHGNMRNVAKASMVAMMAGSDFIKTSTGMNLNEGAFATPEVSLVMVRAIRNYQEETGFKVGYKPAGGIKTAKDYLTYMMLIKEELGDEWLSPGLFRIGASSALTDIERQLEHFTTGRYSANHRFAMG